MKNNLALEILTTFLARFPIINHIEMKTQPVAVNVKDQAISETASIYSGYVDWTISY